MVRVGECMGDDDLSPSYCGPLRNLYFHVKKNLRSRLLTTLLFNSGAKIRPPRRRI